MNLRNYQQSLHKVLSDPNFIPPEYLLDLNLKGDFKTLLTSCSKKARVKFAIEEAKLILPIFEEDYPKQHYSSKQALKTVDEWIENSYIDVMNVDEWLPAIAYACTASSQTTIACAADAIYYAVDTVSASNGFSAYYTAYYARMADPNITLEDQLKRLFKILINGE